MKMRQDSVGPESGVAARRHVNIRAGGGLGWGWPVCSGLCLKLVDKCG